MSGQNRLRDSTWNNHRQGNLLIREQQEEQIELSQEDIAYLRDRWSEVTVSGVSAADDNLVATLTVNNAVGIIGLPSGRTLRIRPKLDCEVLSLLSYSNRISETVVSDAQQAGFQAGNDFLEVIGQLFVNELQRVLQQGLEKQYQRKEAAERYLRGQLNVHRQLQRQGPTPTEFENEYSELTHDTPLNRLVLTAANQLAQLLPTSQVRQRLLRHRELLRRQVSDQPIRPFEQKQIHLSHLTQHYNRILPLSRLILRGEFIQDLERPDEPFPSLTFDMPDVFEEVVRQGVKQQLVEKPLQVTKTSLGTLAERRDGEEVKERRSLEPDLIIQKEGEVRVVGDVKWKEDTSPSRDDLYQIAAYQSYSETPGVVFYPRTTTSEVRQYEYVDPSGQRGPLYIGFIDIAPDADSDHDTYINQIEASIEPVLTEVLSESPESSKPAT